MSDEKPTPQNNSIKETKVVDSTNAVDEAVEKEIGGFENRPEPTRFGDWDVNGRCSDF